MFEVVAAAEGAGDAENCTGSDFENSGGIMTTYTIKPMEWIHTIEGTEARTPFGRYLV